jgi:hypothetical protein
MYLLPFITPDMDYNKMIWEMILKIGPLRIKMCLSTIIMSAKFRQFTVRLIKNIKRTINRFQVETYIL